MDSSDNQDNQPIDDQAKSQADNNVGNHDDENLDTNASVLDFFSQFQVLKVENLILGGNFGPGSVFGSRGSVSADTIAGTVNKVFDLDNSPNPDNTAYIGSQGTDIFISNESTKKWFFSLKNARKEIFVITVAIFGGNSSRFITAASDILYDYLILDVQNLDDKVAAPVSLFDNEPDDLLGDTATKRDSTYFNTASGRIPIEIIRFVDNRAQSRIIDLICGDYKFIKIYDKITNWLKEFIEVNNATLKKLGSFEPEFARTQAALAIGVLAKREYKHYLDTVIQRWALSKDALLRFTVGWVLLGLVADTNQANHSDKQSDQKPPTDTNSVITSRRKVTIWDKVMGDDNNNGTTLLDNVTTLIKHWIGLSNPYLQWTATISASRIGLLAPDSVLKIVKPAAKSKYPAVREALQITLGLLYLSGSNYARKVIFTLAEWINDDDEMVQDMACKEFIALVQGRFDETDDIDTPPSQLSAKKVTGKRKSSLNLWDLIGIEASRMDSTIFSATYTLLAASLSHRDARFTDIVCDSIVRWIVNTENSGQTNAKNALLRLLQQVKSDSYLAQYIDYCLSYTELHGNSIADQLRHQ